MPTSARALLQRFCEVSPEREILASSPTTVGLEKISPSAGQDLSSTVDQHRRRVVPGEKLTYTSAALRTSSTRDSCGAFDLWERAKTGWTSKIEVRGLD